MASIASSYRASARAVSRQLRNQANTRGLRTSSAALAAQNFTMPALSPTMTEGNIASWKVKEGDSFSAGDVLLEVETDKAQMDVEAQDDGIMAKITTGDGSKAIPVGTRIAVIAEPGDDIASLDIPDEEPVQKKVEPKKESKSEPAESSPQKAESTSEPQSKSSSKPPGKGKKQTYPLYPSVSVLLHRHDLKAEDVPATGPSGRLLKGDVLAYLNKIPSSYPAELSTRLTKLSHLDLSNIKPAAPKEAPKKAASAPEKELPPPHVSLSVPVSLTAALQVQKRMQDSLGISLPLSTFVARAIALANEDLPYASRTPTADDLFNSVLGLDKIHPPRSTKHGQFTPQVIALPDPSSASRLRTQAKPKKTNIFDELLGSRTRAPVVGRPGAVGVIGAENVFSLSVDQSDAKRAKVFLERVKSVLEVEPGRLVL